MNRLTVLVEIPKKTKSILVLSQLNDRAFSSLESKARITFEYTIVKVGDLAPLASSAPDQPFSRSGTLEIELNEGTYIVYVKLDQSRTVDTPGGGPAPVVPIPIIPFDSDSDSDSEDSDSGDSSFVYDPPSSGYKYVNVRLLSPFIWLRELNA